MMDKMIFVTMCSLAVLTNPHAALANDENVALVVNGEAISKASLELLISSREERGGSKNHELRRNMEQELVTRLVLSQQARKKHLEQDEQVRAQQELNELAVLSQAYLRNYAEKVEVEQKDIEVEYQKYLAGYNAREFHIRQILVKNEVTAKEMVARLEQGEDFSELAKKNSIDPGASQTGGDIGWFRPDVFIDKRLSEAVEKLSAGEYGHEPVQTRFGWHVVKVEEGPRKVKFPEYHELSEEWKMKMHDQAVMKKVNEHIEALIGSANVELKSKTDDRLVLQERR